jgi:tetratricopeptide (TPR) repeat protein
VRYPDRKGGREKPLLPGIPQFFLAESLAARGEWKKAAKVYQDCLDQLERTVGLGQTRARYLTRRYARTLFLLGQEKQAHRHFSRLLDAVESRHEAGHWHYANTLMEYADFLRECRQWAKVVQVCEKALAIYERTGGPRRKLYRHCRETLALAQKEQEKAKATRPQNARP